MRANFTIAFLAFAGATLLHAQSKSPDQEKPAEVDQFLAHTQLQYDSSVEKAGKKRDAGIAKLRTGYEAALNRLLQSHIDKGNAKEALAVREEIKRIDEETPLKPDQIPGEGKEELLKLRQTYVDEEAELNETYERTQAYDAEFAAAQIDQFAQQLTKRGELDKVADLLKRKEPFLSGIGSFEHRWAGRWRYGVSNKKGAQGGGEMELIVTAEGEIRGTYTGKIGKGPGFEGTINGRLVNESRRLEGSWKTGTTSGNLVFDLSHGEGSAPDTFSGRHNWDQRNPVDPQARVNWTGTKLTGEGDKRKKKKKK